MTSPTTDRRQGLVGNTPIKAPVDLATTGAISLSGEQVIDGVLTASSRVLVKDQADQTTNGIYDSSSAAWTRSQDADGTYDLTQGTLVYVNSGAANANSLFKLSTAKPVVVGSSSLLWTALYSLLNLASSIGSSLIGFIQAGVGAVLRTVQSKLRETVSVKDFGAVGDNVTDDTAAIQAANVYATSVNGIVYFPTPSVAYKYSPAAAVSVAVGWRGDSQYNTVINVANAYAGEVFRLLPSAFMDSLTIQTPGLTKTAGSIGVRVSAANTKDLCVNVDTRRVFIRGFDKGLVHENTYVFHGDHLHIESCNEGIYCVPDASGGLGFITTHTYVNCDIGNNVRNVFYNPPNYSNTVSFLGGNISGATGVTQQASFNKVRVVKFVQIYLEAASTIKAIQFNDVDYASIDGAYVNNTGGIAVASGSSIRLFISDMWCTQATDVLTGADGFQSLSMRDSGLPSSGSVAVGNWKALSLVNTDYNNVHYTALTKGQSFGFKDNSQSGGGTNTVDMNGGNTQRITVTDATAFTVGAPSNAVAGNVLYLTIQNSSGGAMGAITWNAVFKLAGWVNPATGNNRTVAFRYDSTSWHMISLTAADVAN